MCALGLILSTFPHPTLVRGQFTWSLTKYVRLAWQVSLGDQAGNILKHPHSSYEMSMDYEAPSPIETNLAVYVNTMKKLPFFGFQESQAVKQVLACLPLTAESSPNFEIPAGCRYEPVRWDQTHLPYWPQYNEAMAPRRLRLILAFQMSQSAGPHCTGLVPLSSLSLPIQS